MRLIEMLLGDVETRIERAADLLQQRLIRMWILNHVIRALVLLGACGVLSITVGLGIAVGRRLGLEWGVMTAGFVAVALCPLGFTIFSWKR